MKIRIINWLLLSLCIIAGTSVIFYFPITPYDLVTGLNAADFSVKWPLLRFFIEPFYAFFYYGVTLNRDFYQPAITSWFIWIIGIVVVYCIIKKLTIKQTAIKLSYGILTLLTLFIMTALFPVPGAKLIKPEGYVAVDIHSHSMYSHDGIASPNSNLKFHNLHGYDSFFITEHNQTRGFVRFSGKEKYRTVFPGMQMQTKNGVSVLLLSAKDFDGEKYRDQTLAEIITMAHDNNMLVIMPHWWKWHKYTYKELKDLGIDGFEIYNCGYRYTSFEKNEQREMINFAKDNNLMVFGTSDWHGWGYMTDVWTVFKGDTKTNLKDQLAKKPETKVILYRENQKDGALRFIFEPFMMYYYYIKNAEISHVVAFMFWFTIIFMLLAHNKLGKIVRRFLPLVMSIFFACIALYYYFLNISMASMNKFIVVSIIPVLIGIGVLWFILWRINERNIC